MRSLHGDRLENGSNRNVSAHRPLSLFIKITAIDWTAVHTRMNWRVEKSNENFFKNWTYKELTKRTWKIQRNSGHCYALRMTTWVQVNVLVRCLEVLTCSMDRSGCFWFAKCIDAQAVWSSTSEGLIEITASYGTHTLYNTLCNRIGHYTVLYHRFFHMRYMLSQHFLAPLLAMLQWLAGRVSTRFLGLCKVALERFGNMFFGCTNNRFQYRRFRWSRL